jgi:hypothetical protein
MNKFFTAAAVFAALIGASISQPSLASVPAIGKQVQTSSASVNPWDAVGLATRPASEGVLAMAKGYGPVEQIATDAREQMLRNPWLALHFPVRPLSTAQAGTTISL